MDLWLVYSSDKTHIKATSIHGTLWLQTHFETSQWDAISSQSIVLNRNNAEMLIIDAQKAGLSINHLPAISMTQTF